MQILILDSIHGGTVLHEALLRMGHRADLVDVYRGDCTINGSISVKEASNRKYDLIIHPVHLDPAYSLLRHLSSPSITHHEAVRWIAEQMILRDRADAGGRVIEVTGTRGKTTTATALASILPGPGILHTSQGTYRYPEKELLRRMSITPASLITALSFRNQGEWFIGEVSLGFTGIGDLAILTSDEDYRVGGGRLSAATIKQLSSLKCSRLLMAPGITISHDQGFQAGEITDCSEDFCTYQFGDRAGKIENPLIGIEGYQTAIRLAASACLILGYDPDGLNKFVSLPGRMHTKTRDAKTIIDNACSGTGFKTTSDAIRLLKKNNTPFTLVIGQEARSVCDNFPTEEIISAIREGKPEFVILVAGDERINRIEIQKACERDRIAFTIKESIESAEDYAVTLHPVNILISVKTWR